MSEIEFDGNTLRQPGVEKKVFRHETTRALDYAVDFFGMCKEIVGVTTHQDKDAGGVNIYVAEVLYKD